MPLNLPESAREVSARAKADVQRELAASNPFGKNHWIGAIVTGAANRIFDFYIQLKAAIRDNFIDTATGTALTRWAAVWGQQLLAASKASGRAVATGTPGSVIPAGAILAASGAGNYAALESATISDNVISLASLTRVGTTVTAVTTSDHGLANGLSVTVAGATNPEYNTTAPVVVTATDSFQYEIIGSPPDEPTTAATAAHTAASVAIQSEDFGEETNLAAGATLRLQSPIVGVDDILTVDFGEIGGGTDQETEDSLRSRTLDRIQNPVALFNVAAITARAKSIAGVTRVFVQEITPQIGAVTVYFTRDNDVSPIPAGSEVSKVEAAILAIKPANTAAADVHVLAPIGVPVGFTFGALSPNTATMQAAITANLRQFFDEQTVVGENISQDAYRSAIYNTVDTVTGDRVSNFTLSAPVGDITVSVGELGILGDVAYP